MADSTSGNGSDIYNGAVSSGTNAINSFDPNATASNIGGNFSKLNTSQTGDINSFLKGYKDTISAMPTLPQMYSEYGANNNLPQLGQQATTLNNAVLQVPQQNVDLAKGFNFNQGQIDQKTNQDLTKLQPLASAATNAFQNAQTLTNQQVGYGQQQNQISLLPVQAQQQLMSDQFARQMTGFTTQSEAELSGLIAKMNAGVTLSSAEITRANALASAKASYDSAIASANATQNAAATNNQFQIIPAGNTMVNTVTNGAYRAG